MKAVRGLHLTSADSVVVLLEDAKPGDLVRFTDGETVARAQISMGHKMAVAEIPRGAIVVKYGEPIGVATSAIHPGEHVHVDNLRSARARRDG